MLGLPFHLPSYVIMQHWHERYTHDPAVRWLRGLIAELFSEQTGLRHKSNGAAASFQTGDQPSADKSKLSGNHHVA